MQFGVMGGVFLYSGDFLLKEFGVYFEEVCLVFGVFVCFELGCVVVLCVGVNGAFVEGDDVWYGCEDCGLVF